MGSNGKTPKSALIQYWASPDEDAPFHAGPYKTRRTAIAKAPEDLDLSAGQTFQTGKLDTYVPQCGAADSVLDDCMLDATEACGDVADSWLGKVEQSQILDLQERLDQCLSEWLAEHGFTPKFGTIIDMKEHAV